MKHQLILPYLVIVYSLIACFGKQTNDHIDYIAFHFTHSRRIPNHTVSVEIINRQKEIVAKVKSYPMTDIEKWGGTIVDTSFTIEEQQFIALSNKVAQLDKIDFSKALNGGLDGTTCSIEFGTIGSAATYEFWSPDYDTNERGLSYFLELCQELLQIGGLDSKEIL